MTLLPKRIRARLALWNVAMFAAILLAYAGGTCTILLWDLRSQQYNHAVQDLETVEGLLSFGPSGQVLFRDDYHNHPESKLVQERYLEVLSTGNGAVLFRNDRLGEGELGGPVWPEEGAGGYSPRRIRLTDDTRILLISRKHNIDGRAILIRLAYSEEPLWAQYRQLLTALVLSLPVALISAGLAGYFLVRRSLLPLERMAHQARQISPSSLQERLDVDNPDDELGQLGQVFNITLDRLEKSFLGLKQFTSDAAHELRTPLASIRGVGEVAMQCARTQDQYRETIGSMLEEASGLSLLVDSLLMMSSADAGQLTLQHVRMPVLGPVREAAALLEVLLDEKSQVLKIEGDEEAAIEGDRLILRQAFVNLLHNAVKHSPVGGEISMTARVDGARVTVTVQDSGPGIPPEHIEKVFDRFYRVDRSRSREGGGAGLGLAITRWAVEAHAGTVAAVVPSGSQVGTGAIFLIEFPLALKSPAAYEGRL